MEKIYMRGVGEVPAKKAIEVRVGDKLMYESYSSGIVKEVSYRDNMVDMLIEDTLTHHETHFCKYKSHLIGYIPKM